VTGIVADESVTDNDAPSIDLQQQQQPHTQEPAQATESVDNDGSVTDRLVVWFCNMNAGFLVVTLD